MGDREREGEGDMREKSEGDRERSARSYSTS